MTSELSLLRARSDHLPGNCPSWMHFERLVINIVNASSASENDKNLVVSALHYAPSRRGQMAVAWAINELVDPQTQVTQLAEFIYTRMLVPVRAAGGKTSPPSSNPSPRGEYCGETPTEVTAYPRRNEKVKETALKRDGWRCLLTGKVDIHAPSAVKQAHRPRDYHREFLIGAHILPFSLNDFKGNAQARENVSIMWTALQAFTGEDLGSLRGAGIDNVSNMMSLSGFAHELQGRMVLAFQPTDDDNTYDVIAFGPDVEEGVEPYPRRVTFRDHSASGCALPSKVYLRLHAALCRVLHASGRAEELDRILDEMRSDGPATLSEDGAYNAYLDVALWQAIAAH